MKKALTIVFMGLIASAAYAGDVVPGDNVKLLVINGIEVAETTEPAIVNKGFTQALVRMSAKVGRGSNKRVFNSDPFIVQFEMGETDAVIEGPTLYSYEYAVNHFKKKPEWRVVSNGRVVDASINRLPPHSGMLPYSDVDIMIAEYNRDNGILFTEAGSSVPAAVLLASTTSAISVPDISNKMDTSNVDAGSSVEGQTLNTDQLKAWYLKASKSERKEFRKWMIDQE